MRLRAFLVLAGVALLAWPSGALLQAAAAGGVGWNFRISGGAATVTDRDPAAAYNATANQYLVVWQDWRNDSTRGSDIYGQRVSAAGGRLGSDFRISRGAARSFEEGPAVAYNATANQYLVVWEDYRNSSTRGSDIYGQRVSAAGVLLGPNFRISGGAATRNDYSPSVAYNATGNQYLVVWGDDRNRSTRGVDIYGQRVSAAGALLGPNVRVSGGAATGWEGFPAVACNTASNQYLVVWNDSRSDSTRGSDIYGQRVSAAGARLGPNVRISGGAATGQERDPVVAYNPTGNQYLVVWADARKESTRGYDIYGQRVSAAGALLGLNVRLSGGVAASWEHEPAVVYNPTGTQYLVVWNDSRSYSTRGSDIYGQRVSAAGGRLGSDFRISGGAATAYDGLPAVAYNTAWNQYLVVWEDDRNFSTRGTDIYGQRWSP